MIIFKLKSITTIVTPTSAKIASPNPINPNPASTSATSLVINANVMFNWIVCLVCFPRFIRKGISSILSFIKAMSEDSIAMSEPTAPIAIPMFEVARTGASLTPSPTIAIVHDTRVKIKSTGELVHLPSELNKANAAYEALGAKIKETNDGAEVEKLGVKAKELNQRIDLLKSVYPE